MYVLKIEVGYRKIARFEFKDPTTMVNVLEVLVNNQANEPGCDEGIKIMAAWEPDGKPIADGEAKPWSPTMNGTAV